MGGVMVAAGAGSWPGEGGDLGDMRGGRSPLKIAVVAQPFIEDPSGQTGYRTIGILRRAAKCIKLVLRQPYRERGCFHCVLQRETCNS